MLYKLLSFSLMCQVWLFVDDDSNEEGESKAAHLFSESLMLLDPSYLLA